MNTRYMEFFLKTVDVGSINAASQELFISPQGLSQALQQMEKELNEKLFYRQGNGLHLTAAGEIVYESYKEMLQINQDMAERLAGSGHRGDRKNRFIRVISAPIIAMTALPKIISQFRQRNPDAFIKVMEHPPERFFDLIDFDDDTIGVVALPVTMQQQFLQTMPSNLEFRCLYSCRQNVCVSVKSKLAKRRQMSVQDMEQGHVVAFGGDIRLLNHMPEGFDEERVAVQSRNIALCRSVIAADPNAVGFTNSFVENYMKNPGITMVPFEPGVRVDYGYVVEKDTENTLVHEIRAVLENELGQLRKEE